jgi:3D (Asp-Asp-Asp) domain-containing protein
MKLFVRGSVGLMAVLFASYLIFNAKPLLAEIKPSSEPATQQQEKQEPTQAAQQQKKEAAQSTDTTTAPTETAKLSGTVADAAPSETRIVSTENTINAAPQIYNATSYSRAGRGASGMGVHSGTIAADPKVLPFGTRVHLDAGEYSGEYVVTDAGTAIKGRKIDIWLPTYSAACRFGRRNVKLTVLSYGGRKTRQK